MPSARRLLELRNSAIRRIVSSSRSARSLSLFQSLRNWRTACLLRSRAAMCSPPSSRPTRTSSRTTTTTMAHTRTRPCATWRRSRAIVNQQLPVLSINGTRQFTDYSSGSPYVTTSNITLLANSSSSYNQSALNVYVYVYSSGLVQFEGQSLTAAGISMQFSPAAAMPEQQSSTQITIKQTNFGLSENGIQATGGTQFQASSYQSNYWTYYPNGTYSVSPACAEQVPSRWNGNQWSSSSTGAAYVSGNSSVAPTGATASPSLLGSSSSTGGASAQDVAKNAAAVCMARFNSSVARVCGLVMSAPSSVNSYCALSCATIYGAWLNSCAAPLSLKASSAWSAVVAFNASCTSCGPSSYSPFLFSTCGVVGSTDTSSTATTADLLSTWQWPSTCSANCALGFATQLQPFYNSCIAGYPTVPVAASAFYSSCAPRTAPQAVASLSTFVLSSTSVSLTWPPAVVQYAPTDATLYVITRSPANANSVNISVGNNTQYVDFIAQANSVYNYSVTASNSIGSSSASVAVLVSTPDAPPIAPAVLTVVNVTGSSATASWSTSDSPDGLPVYYLLSRQQAGSTIGAIVYRGAATSFTFVDLIANTSYALFVQAGTTLAGLSAASATASFVSTFLAPSAPTGLTIVSSNLSTIILQWAAPVTVGSSAVQLYTVSIVTSTSSAQQFQPLATVSGGWFSSAAVGLVLSPVTTYSLAVNAINTANLTGPYSAAVSTTTPANAPTVLRALSVSQPATGGSASVAYNLTSDVANGGAPITSLRLSLLSPNGSKDITVAATSSSTTLTGLAASTAYNVSWKAANAYGWSASSQPTAFVTKGAAPTIVSFVAGDSTASRTSLGAGSTLTVAFSMLTSQPSVSSQAAITALFAFTPALPGIWTGMWSTTVNGTSAVVLTLQTLPISISAAALPIGLTRVAVNASLTDSAGQSASAQGAVSPVLTGSFYGLPRSTRYFAAVQSPVTVLEDSRLNPFIVQQAVGVYTTSSAVLTYVVTSGSLSLISSTSLVRLNVIVFFSFARNVTLQVPYSNLQALLTLNPVLYTPTPLSQSADVLSVSVSDILTTAAAYPSDSCTVPISVTPVNHAPTLNLLNSTVAALVAGATYPVPVFAVSDGDAVYAPTWPISVLVQAAASTTASFTVSSLVAVPSTLQLSIASGQSGSSVQVSGPLAALNAYLALSPFLFADSALSPSATSTSIVLSVNDTGNGDSGGPSLTASLALAIPVTCVGTAAPSLFSAAFTSDAGSVTLTFSSALDQTAASSSNCTLFFDAATVATLGSGATCVFSGTTSVLVQLGYGATLLPNNNVTLKSASALRRCVGGSTSRGTMTVAAPASPVTPVVSILGATSISSCDELTLYGQATGLAGRPNAATYSWSVAIGTSNSSTSATPANCVLGSGGNTSTLALTAAQLYKQSVYYYFSLTVGSAFGTFNTSSWVVYKSSLPLPQLLVQGSASLTYYPSDSFSVTVTPVMSSCLQGAQALNFSWSAQPFVSLASVVSSQPQITIPAFLLSPGSYALTLTSQVVSNPLLVTSTTIHVMVPQQAVSVSILNGGVQQFSQLASFSLNATSRDPNVALQSGAGWSYAWSCINAVGVACLDNVLGSTFIASTASYQLVPAGHLVGGVYTFTVVASKGNLSAAATVTVSVTANQLPVVGVTSYSTLINPAGSLFYTGSVSDVTGTALTYSWSQVSGPALSLATIAQSLTQKTLVLNNAGLSVFTAGSTYTFQMTSTNAYNQSGFAQVSVTINAPPYAGSLTVSPAVGNGYDTKSDSTQHRPPQGQSLSALVHWIHSS